VELRVEQQENTKFMADFKARAVLVGPVRGAAYTGMLLIDHAVRASARPSATTSRPVWARSRPQDRWARSPSTDRDAGTTPSSSRQGYGAFTVLK
jgi:hypothetical protein